jgi:hypothetical protein
MSANNPNANNMEGWLVESFRLTIFPTPTATISNHNWWLNVVGEEPEIISTQPRTREQIQAGRFGNGRLQLNTHSTRIDWLYLVDPEDVPPPMEQIPTLGYFSDSLRVFHEAMSKWLLLEDVPLVSRIAFGVVLIKPVNDRLEGYELLSQFIRFDFKDQNVSDFLYQINRPRLSSTVKDLTINRLSKWSVAKIQQNLLESATSKVFQFKEFFASRVELDINSTPEFTEVLEKTALPKLFDELIKFSSEIASMGDIA